MRRILRDWAAAGLTFGVPTCRIERLDELDSVIRGVDRSDGPLLVDVPIATHAGGRDRQAKGGPT